jgi:hypothetical protein
MLIRIDSVYGQVFTTTSYGQVVSEIQGEIL